MSDPTVTPPLEERAPWTAQVLKELRGEDLAGLGTNLNDVVTNVRAVVKERDDLKAKPLLPGEGAKPEEIAAFHKAMGVPDTPDGYTLELPAGIPADTIKPEDVKSFRELAHKLHISLAAAKELMNFETTRAVAVRTAYAEAQTKKTEAQKDALIAKYGVEGAKAKLADAYKFIEAVGGKELSEELQASQGNNPRLIDGFIKLGVLFTEKGISPSGTGASAEGEVDLSKVYTKSHSQMQEG